MDPKEIDGFLKDKVRSLQEQKRQDEILGLISLMGEKMSEDIRTSIAGIKIDAPVIPEIKVPDITIPEIKIPDIVIPEMKMPEINVPEVKLPVFNIPEIKLPTINVPEPKVTVNVPEIKIPKITVPNVIMPKSMDIKGDVGLRDVDKKNPLPVQLMGPDGKPLLMPSPSGGGGRSDFFTIKDIQTSSGASVIDQDTGAMKVSGSFSVTASNSSTQAIDSSGNPYSQANPFPVVFGSSGTTGTNIIDSTGVAYSGSNPLPVDITQGVDVQFGPGTIDEFGHLVTGTINNQVDIQFYRDTVANLTTVTTANGGTASATNGMATFSATAAANSRAQGVSPTNTTYTAGGEIYALFTAGWTGTGGGTSYQRIGIYNGTDGFFIGREANSFGVSIEKGGSITSTPQANFSEDTLTGAAGSLFTRDGVPEAVVLTNLNVWRIRFGWVGSAPINFEILSPDGNWVTFHRMLYPNLVALPHINTADLPVTCDVFSGNSGNALTIITNCWAAGTTQALGKIDATLTSESFAQLTRAVITGETTAGGGGFVNVKVDPSGAVAVSGTVAVSGITNTVGTALVNSTGVQYSGSNPLPIGGSVEVSGVTGSIGATILNGEGLARDTWGATQVGTWNVNTVASITATVAAANVDSTGVQYSGSNPMPVSTQRALESIGLDVMTVRQVSGASDSVAVLSMPAVVVTSITNSTASALVDSGGVQYSGSNPVPTKEIRSATGTNTSVADNAASVTILAANTARLGATVANDSSAVLYLLLGATAASTTNYTCKIASGGYYEVPFGYTGQLTGIWASDPGDGAARVTEIT